VSSMQKINAFFKNYYVQLTLFFLLALFLILVSIVFLEDIGADSDILIYNIFGTLAFSGLLFSFHLSKTKIRQLAQAGKTRADIYKDYMLRLIVSVGVSVLLVAYYIVLFKIYVNEQFDYDKILFLPMMTLFLSLLGFLLGMIRMKTVWLYVLFGILLGGLALIVIYFQIGYYLDLALLLGVLILSGVCYRLIIRKNI
jgi:hypothetical protein